MRIILIFVSLLLISCSSNIKQKIGLETQGPNEYGSQKTKPLEIPPHYDLPAPSGFQSVKNYEKSRNKNKISDSEQALIEDLDG